MIKPLAGRYRLQPIDTHFWSHSASKRLGYSQISVSPRPELLGYWWISGRRGGGGGRAWKTNNTPVRGWPAPPKDLLMKICWINELCKSTKDGQTIMVVMIRWISVRLPYQETREFFEGGGANGRNVERQGGWPGAGLLEGSEVQRFAGRRESRNFVERRFGGGWGAGWLVGFGLVWFGFLVLVLVWLGRVGLRTRGGS